MEFILNRVNCKKITPFLFYNVVYLSNFIHSNYFFKTILQLFHIALSHISIRTRNKPSARVTI